MSAQYMRALLSPLGWRHCPLLPVGRNCPKQPLTQLLLPTPQKTGIESPYSKHKPPKPPTCPSLLISWSPLKQHFPKAMFPGVGEGQRLAAGVAMESFRRPSALGGLDFPLPQGYFLRSDALKDASQL